MPDADTVSTLPGTPLHRAPIRCRRYLWLKHHEPETFDVAYKLMVPGGYLVARFTGESPRIRQVYRPRMVDQGPKKGNKIQFVVLPGGAHIEITTRVNE